MIYVLTSVHMGQGLPFLVLRKIPKKKVLDLAKFRNCHVLLHMGKGVPKISILNGTETNGPRGKKTSQLCCISNDLKFDVEKNHIKFLY